MYLIKPLFLTCLLILLSFTGFSQKKKKKSKEEEQAIHFYEGEKKPVTEVARLVCPPVDNMHPYFIGVDGTPIPNNSLVSGAQELFILPGQHSIRMRFVSGGKGSVAAPIAPFDSCLFEAGKTYVVKYEYTPSEGDDFMQRALDSRIRLWIEDEGIVLAERLVDGMGDPVGE